MVAGGDEADCRDRDSFPFLLASSSVSISIFFSFLFPFIPRANIDYPMPAYRIVVIDFHFYRTSLLEFEDCDADGEGVEEGLGDVWAGGRGGVEGGGGSDCEG